MTFSNKKTVAIFKSLINKSTCKMELFQHVFK